MNMEEQLRAVVTQATTDASLWHTIIHGNDKTMVPTENGNVPTVAKQMADVRAEVISNVTDYLGKCQTAKNETQQLKAETQAIKEQTATLKSETLTLRNEAESFKNQSQNTFNMIATTTNASVSNIKNEGTTQIALVQSAVAEQVTEATNQANRATNATNSKLNIDCSNMNLTSLLSSMGATSNATCNVLKFPLKMPDGSVRTFILQFGHVVVSGDSQASFTFPEAFPNAVLMTQGTFYYGINNGSDAGCAIHTVTTTGAIAQNGCNWNLGICWMALGY